MGQCQNCKQICDSVFIEADIEHFKQDPVNTEDRRVSVINEKNVQGSYIKYEESQSLVYQQQKEWLKQEDKKIEEGSKIQSQLLASKIHSQQRASKISSQQRASKIKSQVIQPNAESEKEEQDNFFDFRHAALLYQSILLQYHQHDIDSAYSQAQSFLTAEKTIQNNRLLSKEQFESQLKIIQAEWQKQNEVYHIEPFNRSILTKIMAEFEDMNYYYNLSVGSPFEEKYNEQGVKISTRKDENSIGVLIETQLHSPFQNLTTFFTNISTFPDFIPFCEEAVLLKDCGRNSKVGYVLINFPMLSMREAYFQALAYNRMNSKKQNFLYARTIQDKPDVQQALGVPVKINPKFVQLKFTYFVIRYEPLREGVGNLKLAVSFDFGISLPDWIEDRVIRKFGETLFNRLLKINEKFAGSKWEENIKKDPGLYYLVKEKMKEFLKNGRKMVGS